MYKKCHYFSFYDFDKINFTKGENYRRQKMNLINPSKKTKELDFNTLPSVVDENTDN